MWKNNLTLPLFSLVLAALGALLLALDFGLQSQPHAALTAPASAPAGASSPPTLDGQIAEGEYAHRYHDETTGIGLYWTVLGDQIYFGLRSPGSGWVALALSPSGPVMQGGDIIIGYLSDGLHIQDEYADSPMSHKADTELGGQDDILEAAGSTNDGGTIIEFRRKLDTGDLYDHPITEGEEEVQLAYSDSADFASYHSKRSAVTLQFLGGG